MKFDIITIFPNLFDSFLQESLLFKAIEKKLIKIQIHNLRRWTKDKHHKVDDRPYGGGPGMILKVEPLVKALKTLQSKKAKVLMMDPAGKQFTQKMAQKLSKEKRIIILCGRYEGFDNRITKFVDEKISVGPYVLNGGEVPAMTMIEAIARLVPGFVGKAESLKEETFSGQGSEYVEYPQYTRPAEFAIHDPRSAIKKLKVPKVLLSGDHKKIKEWREKKSGVQNIK